MDIAVAFGLYFFTIVLETPYLVGVYWFWTYAKRLLAAYTGVAAPKKRKKRMDFP